MTTPVPKERQEERRRRRKAIVSTAHNSYRSSFYNYAQVLNRLRTRSGFFIIRNQKTAITTKPKTPPFQGRLTGLSSVSINMSYRIVLEMIIKDDLVILVDVGRHEQVN